MLKLLPPTNALTQPYLLKQAIKAARALGELKGAIATIPNEKILIDTLLLNEAKNSNAVENIITTYDELYRANIEDYPVRPSTKEVQNYVAAVKHGYTIIKRRKVLSVNNIIAIQKINCPHHGEIRKIPGTVLRHETSRHTIYTPPQSHQEILKLLNNLEKFINDDSFCDSVI